MDYATARPQIKSGDLLAFSHQGFASLPDIESQAVRMFTRSEYSHVGVAWRFADRLFILEAVVPAVRIFPLSLYENGFFWIPVDLPFSPAAEEFAFSRIGQRYSKWEAIRGYFGLTADNKRWQCAEYARAIFEANGMVLPGVATPTSVVLQVLEKFSQLKWVKM